jgi:quinol monooxygenase YgiN
LAGEEVNPYYTILVEFWLTARGRAPFLQLIRENARASLIDEPGCQRFDVLVPKGEEDRVVLYEIYRDAKAFEAHCNAPHFHTFARASNEYVLNKRVTELALEVLETSGRKT